MRHGHRRLPGRSLCRGKFPSIGPNTRSLHRWAGAWAQRENDREGRFEITLSPDYLEGEGRWWYTRIESDAAPTKAGGTFHVMKVQSIVENQPVPGARASQ